MMLSPGVHQRYREDGEQKHHPSSEDISEGSTMLINNTLSESEHGRADF